MLDLYEKDYIRDIKHQKLNEAFPSAEKALDMVSGPTKYPTINKILDALFLSLDGQGKTVNVIKRLKSLDMDDDEINELRDVYVKIYKNALDKTLKKHFTLKDSKLEDYYQLDKSLFSLYKFDIFLMYYSSKIESFVKELNDFVTKDFKVTYEARLKNRQYGKTKHQQKMSDIFAKTLKHYKDNDPNDRVNMDEN